eukprot:7344375-Prymnesium_polylepis.1
MGQHEVIVSKEKQKSKIGMRLQDRLVDGFPVVTLIMPGGAAEASGSLNKGDVIISINGQQPRGHKHALAILAEQAPGDIKLLIE